MRQKTFIFLALMLTTANLLFAQRARLCWSDGNNQDTTVTVWRGERITIEGRAYLDTIPSEPLVVRGRARRRISCETGFLGGVLTDGFKGCGKHPQDLPSYTVYDVLDTDSAWIPETADDGIKPLPARIFCSVDVPRNIASGRQYVEIRLIGKDTGHPYGYMGLYLNVLDRTLPPPHEYKFRSNFWQQPYSVSRWYGLDEWSQDHMDKLRPYMHRLARCGQKVVSAILFYEPWGDQSYDKFSPMVQTTLKKDSTWAYDYHIFDRWVRLMADCGIDQQIDCYSMIPWDMNFRYWDEAKGDYSYLKTTTSSAEYENLWTSFLHSFARHLREKGWFGKTRIAMDERQMPDMIRAYKVAQKAEPGIKMSLAGNYHSELSGILADYSVAYGQKFPADTLAARRSRGQYSTVYTCCTEPYPNIFTNSHPIEGTYIPLYAIANGFDGYLHWSWMNWADDPLHDSRFRLFSPGDTYVIYPDNHSSLRWERYIEGVQLAEKVQFMRDSKAPCLSDVEEALARFGDGDASDPADVMQKVEHIKQLLNK